jgi:biotin carboxyl carrier protein
LSQKDIFKEINEVIDIAEEFGLYEVGVEEDNRKIRIKRRLLVKKGNQRDVPSKPHPKEKGARHRAEENIYELKSPLSGIFYRAPKPDAEPFVERGETVQIGQTLALIEAMKSFNEIKSDVSGKVMDILPKNAQLVTTGEVLFKIEVM